MNHGDILVVDDTPDARELLVEILTAAGYQVRPVTSGELALAAVAAQPPELILLDLCMPGLDGLEVCRRLKARPESSGIPVVFTSAFGKSAQRVEALKLGAVDFIDKPFQREELLARVQTHLEPRRLRVQLEQQAAELRRANERLRNELAEQERSAALLALNQELQASRASALNLMNDTLEARNRLETANQRLQAEITERKRSETALRALSSRQEAMLAAVPDIIMEVDTHKVYGWANQAGLAFFGDNVIGKPADFYFEGEQPIYQSVQPLFNGEQDLVYVESWQRRKDGEKRLLAWRCRVLKDENGSVTGALSSARDITEARRAEAALRLAHERLRRFIDANVVGIVIANAAGTVFEANDYYLRLIGYTRAELDHSQVDWRAITPPEWLPADEQALRELRARGTCTPYEKEYLRRDGTRVSVLLADALLPGPEEQIAAFTLDLTEHKQVEDQLRTSEQEFRTLAEAVPQIVWITRADGWNIYFNQRWMDYTGLTLAESCGHGWNTPFHPDDRQRAWDAWQNATQNDADYALECRLRRADGAYHWWLIRGAPLRDASGKILKWFGTCTDIEDLKQAEAEIRQLNQTLEQRVKARTAEMKAVNHELEAFSYSVSHDLRAPLRAIDGWAQALLEDFGDKLGESGRQMLNRQRSASQRMAALIDDLLQLSRLTRQPLWRQTVAMPALVRRVWEELHPASAPQTAELVVGALCDCQADPALLTQVFVNLLGNALKFSSHHAHPRIEVGCQAGPAPDCVYFVKDNGAGFDMRYAHRLFSAFQRLHNDHEFPGTGIGLALTQRIIRRHGGRIWAESAVGQGATFYFTLPGDRPPEEETTSFTKSAVKPAEDPAPKEATP